MPQSRTYKAGFGSQIAPQAAVAGCRGAVGGWALTSGGDQRRSRGVEQVGEEDATQLPARRAWHGLSLPGRRGRMWEGNGHEYRAPAGGGLRKGGRGAPEWVSV